MSHVASLRVLFIAALATSLSALTLSLLNSGAARAEDTCLTTPKSGAPAGGHWRYRLERGTQRKCWHLATDGRKGESQKAQNQQDQKEGQSQKGRNAALRAEPQAEPDTLTQPQLPAEKLTQTEPQPGPAPMNDAVQRFTQPLPRAASPVPAAPQSFGSAFPPVQSAPPVQAADPAAPSNVVTTPAPAAADALPRVSADTTPDAQNAAPSAEQPAPAQPPAPVAAKRKAAPADVDTMRMLPFAIGALAASLVAAGFIFASASRRRQDSAIVRIVDLNTKAPPRRVARDVASPPLAMREPWQDEGNEEADALQRQPLTRRRAAA